MKRKLHYAGLLSLLLFLWACKKDPPVQDPCSYLRLPTTGFKMYFLEPYYNWSSAKPDTILVGGAIDTLYVTRFGTSHCNLTFENTGGYVAETKWTIGSDTTTFTSPKFFLRFDNYNDIVGRSERIDVELRTKRAPMRTCFPNDDGLDTIRQSFVLADGERYKPPQLGTFKGYIKGQERDTFSITIELFDNSGHFGISNFPNGAREGALRMGTKLGDMVVLMGSHFALRSSAGFKHQKSGFVNYCVGYAKRDSIFIEYQYGGENPKYAPEYFVGVRQ